MVSDAQALAQLQASTLAPGTTYRVVGNISSPTLTPEQQQKQLAQYGYQAQLKAADNQRVAADLQKQAAASQYKEQVSAAQFNIESARLNAQYALENVKYIQNLTNETVFRLRQDNDKKISSMRSKFAANGLAVDTGSPLEMALQQAKQGELTVQDQILAGNVNARAYDQQAQQYLRQSGRNADNLANMSTAYNIQVQGIDVGLQTQQIAALPSLLQGYQTIYGTTPSVNLNLLR